MSDGKLITWNIGGTGGAVGSGIPSFDVAVSIATDYERYSVGDDETLERAEVEVLEEDEGCGPYTLVIGASSRGLGISSEERCGECRRTR